MVSKNNKNNKNDQKVVKLTAKEKKLVEQERAKQFYARQKQITIQKNLINSLHDKFESMNYNISSTINNNDVYAQFSFKYEGGDVKEIGYFLHSNDLPADDYNTINSSLIKPEVNFMGKFRQDSDSKYTLTVSKDTLKKEENLTCLVQNVSDNCKEEYDLLIKSIDHYLTNVVSKSYNGVSKRDDAYVQDDDEY
jgi:hypothetical protein